MKTLLQQLQDLNNHLRYATRNEAAIDKALKQVYSILITISQQLVDIESRQNDNQQKSVDPYNPGTGSVCGSAALHAIGHPIAGEDHED